MNVQARRKVIGVDNRKPKHADLILVDIQLHTTPVRKPKEWYSELMSASRRHAPVRIYTEDSEPFQTEDGRVGLKLKFPASREIFEQYVEALRTGTRFKLYTPKVPRKKVN